MRAPTMHVYTVLLSIPLCKRLIIRLLIYGERRSSCASYIYLKMYCCQSWDFFLFQFQRQREQLQQRASPRCPSHLLYQVGTPISHKKMLNNGHLPRYKIHLNSQLTIHWMKRTVRILFFYVVNHFRDKDEGMHRSRGGEGGTAYWWW